MITKLSSQMVPFGKKLIELDDRHGRPQSLAPDYVGRLLPMGNPNSSSTVVVFKNGGKEIFPTPYNTLKTMINGALEEENKGRLDLSA